MTNMYDTYMIKILSLFDREYTTALSAINSESVTENLIPLIYRRWYYAALLEDTPFSPANLIGGLNREYSMPTGTVPHIRLDSVDNGFHFRYQTVQYSLDNHPIIADSKKVLDACLPIIHLDKDNKPPNYNVVRQLHIHDKNYVDFIISLLLRCRLLVKVPSINTVSYQPSPKSDEFFSDSNISIFDKFVRTALDLFVEYIRNLIPISWVFAERLHRMLIPPYCMDRILSSIWGTVHYDICMSMGTFSFDFDTDIMPDVVRQRMIDSTSQSYLSLDKHFLLPFSYYFQLIRPLYMTPFDMAATLGLLDDTTAPERGFEKVLFKPCSRYTLTELGSEYLRHTGESLPFLDRDFESVFIGTRKPSEVIDMILEPPCPTQFKRLYYTVSDLRNDYSTPVYRIKIKTKFDKRFWQTAEFEERTTIIEIHDYICDIFHLSKACEFNLYISEEANLFSEYGTRFCINGLEWKNLRPSMLVSELSLSKLNINKNQKLLYVIYHSKEPYFEPVLFEEVLFELEVLDIITSTFANCYPRVVNVSKHVREYSPCLKPET